MRYAVVIHKSSDDEAGSFGVTVPDLPGCISVGDTLDEAFIMVEEAIIGHIETLLMTAQPVPPMRPLEEHRAHEDYQDALYWGFVEVDLKHIPAQRVRVNIMVPTRLMVAVDEQAKLDGETRSSFMVKAASEYMRSKAR